MRHCIVMSKYLWLYICFPLSVAQETQQGLIMHLQQQSSRISYKFDLALNVCIVVLASCFCSFFHGLKELSLEAYVFGYIDYCDQWVGRCWLLTNKYGNTMIMSTLWEPAYNIFVLWFRPKNSSFWLPYQCPISSADCATELFKGSNGSASLVDCIRKNYLVGGCGFFVTDVISEVVLESFWFMLPGLGPKCFAEVKLQVFTWSFQWKLQRNTLA